MDVVLSGIAIDWFKILSFVVALVVGAGLILTFRRKWQWGIVGAVAAYMVATAGVGIYILLHVNDSRWSAGKEPLLQAPSFSDTPLVGPSLEPLDGFLSDTASSINELVAFRHAIPVAQEFFGLAGWAFLALIPLTLVAVVIGKFQPSPEQREINELREELRQVRGYIGMEDPKHH